MDSLPILSLIVAVPAVFLLITGLRRIIRRKAKITSWKYERPHWAVRTDREITGFRPVLGGIIRVIIAIALFIAAIALLLA